MEVSLPLLPHLLVLLLLPLCSSLPLLSSKPAALEDEAPTNIIDGLAGTHQFTYDPDYYNDINHNSFPGNGDIQKDYNEDTTAHPKQPTDYPSNNTQVTTDYPEYPSNYPEHPSHSPKSTSNYPEHPSHSPKSTSDYPDYPSHSPEHPPASLDPGSQCPGSLEECREACLPVRKILHLAYMLCLQECKDRCIN